MVSGLISVLFLSVAANVFNALYLGFQKPNDCDDWYRPAFPLGLLTSTAGKPDTLFAIMPIRTTFSHQHDLYPYQRRSVSFVRSLYPRRRNRPDCFPWKNPPPIPFARGFPTQVCDKSCSDLIPCRHQSFGCRYKSSASTAIMKLCSIKIKSEALWKRLGVRI